MTSHSIRSEFGPLLRLALPVVIAELGWMAMGVADTIMVGRLGPEAIGAVALGNMVFHTIGLLVIGILLGLDTLISQAFGASDIGDANHSFRQGLWLAVFVAPILLLIMWAALPMLHLLGLEPAVYELTQPFGRVLALSVLPIAFYTVQRRYLQALHLVEPVMYALVSANLVNLALNWTLIFGHLGFPAMGVAGAAWSTVGARIYLAGFLCLYLLRRETKSPTGLFRWEGPDRKRLRELFRLGLPAAGHIFLEIAGFAAATAMAASFPAILLAAHEITLNHAALTYMVPLGISSAAAVRVGNAIGARNGERARAAGHAAILTGLAFMSLSALTMFALPSVILGFYTVNREVIAAAVPLLFWAAAFQMFDGLQCVATGALRGIADTHTAFAANLAGYWAIGLPIGGWLCFREGYGVSGLWIGLTIGLATVATIVVVRWHRAKLL
jgi:MATE family multidrug resistance protein